MTDDTAHLRFTPLFSDMAAVSLQGRSHAPMAQFALDFIDRLALAMVPV